MALAEERLQAEGGISVSKGTGRDDVEAAGKEGNGEECCKPWAGFVSDDDAGAVRGDALASGDTDVGGVLAGGGGEGAEWSEQGDLRDARGQMFRG